VVVGVLAYNKLQERGSSASPRIFGSRMRRALGGSRAAPGGSCDAHRAYGCRSAGGSATGSGMLIRARFVAPWSRNMRVVGRSDLEAIVDSRGTDQAVTGKATTGDRKLGPLAATGEYEARAGLPWPTAKAPQASRICRFQRHGAGRGRKPRLGLHAGGARGRGLQRGAAARDALLRRCRRANRAQPDRARSAFSGTRIAPLSEPGSALTDGRFAAVTKPALKLYSLSQFGAPAFSAEGMKRLRPGV